VGGGGVGGIGGRISVNVYVMFMKEGKFVNIEID